MTRDPLTERFVRERRHINPDPKAWHEGPNEPAEPQLWKRKPWHRFSGLILLLSVLCSSAISVTFVWVVYRWLFT